MKRLRRIIPKTQYTLANQISLVLIGLCLMIIVGIGLIVVLLVRTSLENHILDGRQRVAHGVALRIEQFLDEQQEQMKLALDHDEIAFELEQSLELALARNAPLLELAVLSPKGEIVAISSKSTPLLSNASLLQQSDIQPESEYTISSLYFSPQYQPYVIFGLLLTEGAYANHAIIGRLDVWTIWDVLNEDNLSPYEHTYIVDRDGLLIVDSSLSPDRFQMPLALRDVDHPYSGQYSNAGNVKVLGATSPIAQTDWLVINEINRDIAFDDVQRIIITILLLLILIAGITLLLGHGLARQITRPLQEISRLAQQVESGQYNQTAPIQGPIELHMFANTFNHMEKAIAEREVELRTANAALQIRTEELATLSRQIIAVKEEEQRRISREIHDGFGQTLAALKMSLDMALRIDDSAHRTNLLKEASKVLEHAIDEAHTISENLRPTVLDDLGLNAALEWYLNQFQQRFNIKVQHHLDKTVAQHLSAECEITAYRFIQEALNNVYKHANATQIDVKLRQQANYAMLAVKDNGIGFDYWQSDQVSAERLHLGISGMRERLTMLGGELVVHSAPQQGTTLIALLPMLNEQK